jgi:hypothetical protein
MAGRGKWAVNEIILRSLDGSVQTADKDMDEEK